LFPFGHLRTGQITITESTHFVLTIGVRLTSSLRVTYLYKSVKPLDCVYTPSEGEEGMRLVKLSSKYVQRIETCGIQTCLSCERPSCMFPTCRASVDRFLLCFPCLSAGKKNQNRWAVSRENALLALTCPFVDLSSDSSPEISHRVLLSIILSLDDGDDTCFH
jgi:hypothetical protein